MGTLLLILRTFLLTANTNGKVTANVVFFMKNGTYIPWVARRHRKPTPTGLGCRCCRLYHHIQTLKIVTEIVASASITPTLLRRGAARLLERLGCLAVRACLAKTTLLLLAASTVPSK